MEKEKIMLNTWINYEVFLKFKAILAYENKTISDFIEEKIIEKASSINFEVK